VSVILKLFERNCCTEVAGLLSWKSLPNLLVTGTFEGIATFESDHSFYRNFIVMKLSTQTLLPVKK